jgi:hypothetical protein
MLEKYFSSPLPTLLRRVWSSISGKPYTAQTSSLSNKKDEKDSAQSSLNRQSTKSSSSISSFLPWAKDYSESPSKTIDSAYKAKLRSSKDKKGYFQKHQILKLEDMGTGKQLDFLLFNDSDLPFLSKNNE